VARLNRLTAGASLKVTAATERLQRVVAAVLAKAAAAAAKAHTAAVRASNNSSSSARKPTAAEAALLARLRALQRQGKVWAIRMAEMRAYEAALAASTAAAAAATAAAEESSAAVDTGEVTHHSRAHSSVTRDDDKSRAVSDVAADGSSSTAAVSGIAGSAAATADAGTGSSAGATGEQRSVFQSALDAFAASRQPRPLVTQLRQAAPIVAPLGTPAPSLAAPLSSSSTTKASTATVRAAAGAAAATTAGALLSGSSSSHHSSAKQTFATSSGSQHAHLPVLSTATTAAAAVRANSDALEELYWQQQQLRPSSPITQAQPLRVEGHIALPWPQRSTATTGTAATASNTAAVADTSDYHISAPSVTISARPVVVKPVSRALARAYCRRIRNSSAPIDDLFSATTSDAAVGPAMLTDAWGAGVWPPHLKSASFSTSTPATSRTRRGASLAVPSPPTREDSGPLGGSWARSRGPSLRARAALASVFGRSPAAHSSAAAAAAAVTAAGVSDVDTVQPCGSGSSSAHGSGVGRVQLPAVSDSVKIW
jgi:trimeric autotransporter adhesin